jgi:acyl carrier protein
VIETKARELIINALVNSSAMKQEDAEQLNASEQKDLELASLGIDSMAIINFCMALEEEFKRDVEIEELIEHSTLNDLAKHFAKT